jgi:predicted phosphodiesterase
MPKTTLAIGDPHVGPEDSMMERFSALGNLALSYQPDNIVFIGDFMTNDSLSFFDKNKRKLMEGRRFADDVAACNEALDLFQHPLNKHNEERRAAKKKQYRPNIVFLEGNHEYRLARHLEADPTFEGLLDVRNLLNLDDRGIIFIPFKKYLDIDNVRYTHIPHSTTGAVGSSGMQVSVVKKALLYTGFDVVFGHTHKLEFAHRTTADGNRVHGLNIGMFTDGSGEGYMDGLISDWWDGVCLINSDNGFKSFTTFDMSEVMEYI